MITVDTNLPIYAIDPRHPVKRAAAECVVRALGNRLSLLAPQAVGEFQIAAIRQLKASRTPEAQYAAMLLDDFETFPSSKPAARAALIEMATGRLNYWDALLLASVAEAGCTVMLSEDMQDGAILLGLEIVNPFGAAGVGARAAELLGMG